MSEFDRLMSIYDSISAEDPKGSLTNIMLITDDSYYTASKRSDEIFHIQGKNRSISSPEGVSPRSYSDEDNPDEFQEQMIQDKLIEILNKYIENIVVDDNYDEFKLGALVIWLMGKSLESIIFELKLPQEVIDQLKLAYQMIFDNKARILDEFISYFVSRSKLQLADRTRQVGTAIFETRPDKSCERYYSDIQSESFDKNDYEKLISLRDEYLKKTINPTFNNLIEIIGPMSAATFKRRKSNIIAELSNLVTVDEVKYINNLLI